jgi:hypothetical protein
MSKRDQKLRLVKFFFVKFLLKILFYFQSLVTSMSNPIVSIRFRELVQSIITNVKFLFFFYFLD